MSERQAPYIWHEGNYKIEVNANGMFCLIIDDEVASKKDSLEKALDYAKAHSRTNAKREKLNIPCVLANGDKDIITSVNAGSGNITTKDHGQLKYSNCYYDIPRVTELQDTMKTLSQQQRAVGAVLQAFEITTPFDYRNRPSLQGAIELETKIKERWEKLNANHNSIRRQE